ncbi:oligoendopeptidase F [Vagococcus lutrae]|uniref:oligoendopeptidase F n=1 Tax=Vagococcus lutrae TaxID=81947 RepID=UPI00200EE083|nr:oligoendopeptidase F [Vagococcus lutrae]MDT2806498.1 oligoendopeptidase F [Vagococcus lutrae]UQF18190.1 oligoendopeptidase F [Vagococcus lutrae]
MSTPHELPKRDALPVEVTWDLTKIFENDEAFETALKEFEAKIPEVQAIKGTLAQGADAFKKALDLTLALSRELETLYVYSHLKNDQDTANAFYQGMNSRMESMIAKTSEAISWFQPELFELTDEQIWAYFDELPELEIYRHYITSMLADRPHVLSEQEEALLAGAGEIFGSAGKTFSILNNADLEFPVIENEKGEKVKLSHGVYGQLMESTDPKVREAAFKGLYQVYEQFQNTLATTLSTNVKVHNYRAKVRHFSSAREAALSANHIPESVHDTLISVVHEHLPLLHRYVALRKKLLKVDSLHMYDMYTPILGDAPIRYSYDEAVEKSKVALKPLGEEYGKVVQEAYENRWIDVVENQGKRSGAYSSGAYDTVPYILMNWHDSLDQLYTLVHEMGHSVHSYFTRSNQPYVYGDYSIFLAEIASTTNENILTEHLLATETDPKVRAFILNRYLDGFKGTVFRQTQFAEFEHFIHEEDAKGVPLTSDYLNDYYADLNAKYYGPAVERDSEIALEWSRIPHFYYNYYVYQYSTGFAAASALADKIVKGEEGALDKYLTYLKAGRSDYPIEIMKKAGVDMTQATYLEEAMKVFEARLNEFETLVDQL